MAVFLINSRLGLLCATHYLIQHGPHFFRSYVCILPSSLTRVLSCALDYSSFLPVSVSGTVLISLALDSISWHLDYIRFASTFSPLARQLTSGYGFAYTPQTARRLNRNYHSPAGFHLMRLAFETNKGSGI